MKEIGLWVIPMAKEKLNIKGDKFTMVNINKELDTDMVITHVKNILITENGRMERCTEKEFWSGVTEGNMMGISLTISSMGKENIFIETATFIQVHSNKVKNTVKAKLIFLTKVLTRDFGKWTKKLGQQHSKAKLVKILLSEHGIYSRRVFCLREVKSKNDELTKVLILIPYLENDLN